MFCWCGNIWRYVLPSTAVFRDFYSLGSMILSWSCLTMNFSFVGIKWRRFLIIKLPFSFKTLYERGWSFGEITHSFLSQVFSLSVLILTVSPGFKVDRRFWVSGSIAALVIGLGCALIEGRLMRIGRLNTLWADDSPFSSGWEFKNSIDKNGLHLLIWPF